MLRRTGLLILGLACLSRAQSPADWRFAHPDADLRVSINLQSVLRSPAVTNAILQASLQAPKEQTAKIQEILGILGSIERISVSARQKTAKDSDALVLVTGTFDPKWLQEFFPSKGTSQVRQVGPRSVLMGEGASFTQAARRMAGPAVAAPGELEQSDIWIEAGPGILKQQQSQQTPPAFRNIQALSLGMNLTESPEINLILRASDAASAQQLLTGIQGMMALAIPSPKDATLLTRALQMRQEGDRIRLHFVAPPELMQMAQAQAASGALAEQLQPLLGLLGVSGGAAPAAGARPTPPEPQVVVPDTGGKIIIYGLENGPREVKQGPSPAVVKLP